MTELDEKMQPIKDTFMLIFKLSQVESILSPVPKALSSNFETQVNGLNVEFKKVDDRQNYSTTKEISPNKSCLLGIRSLFFNNFLFFFALR